MSFSDISPTAAQRAAIGTSIKIIVDPWNYKRYIVFGDRGGLICDDFTVSSPIWRQINLFANNPAAVEIDMTYAFGSGPATAHIGDIVNFTSANLNPSTDFTTQQFRVTFSDCVLVTIISVDNFFEWHCKVGGSCGPNEPWFYLDCDGHEVDSPLYPTTSTPADIPDNVCMSQIGASGGSTNTGGDGTPYTIQMRLEALCILPEFSDDIVGCMNARGRFYWIGHQTVSGTEKLFLYRTSNYFTSNQATEIADYVAGINYSVQVNDYHANSVYVTAGDPAGSDATAYYSIDGGVTFTPTGVVLKAAGGALSVPYNGIASGANIANAGTATAFMVIVGKDTTTKIRDIAGSVVSITSVPTGELDFRAFGIAGPLANGLKISVISTDGQLFWSDNGGGIWTGTLGTAPINGPIHGLTGLPNRSASLLVFGSASLYYTNDRGASYTDLSTDYLSFAGSVLNGGTIISYACVQMIRYYSIPVTT